MLRKLLATGAVLAGVGIAGTAQDAQAGGHHHHDHHHGGWDGGRVHIQPYPYYGGSYYRRPGGYYGRPCGTGYYGRPYGRPYGVGYGGTGVVIGSPGFTFSYYGR